MYTYQFYVYVHFLLLEPLEPYPWCPTVIGLALCLADTTQALVPYLTKWIKHYSNDTALQGNVPVVTDCYIILEAHIRFIYKNP